MRKATAAPAVAIRPAEKTLDLPRFVRVSNPSNEDFTYAYDGDEYTVLAGETLDCSREVGYHLKFYNDELEIEPLAMSAVSARPAAPPPTFPCGVDGCGQSFTDAAAFQKHVMGHLQDAAEQQ